ncbi:hypothetical protein C8R45DRAFT_1205860 [Mycena sanguinolenta]|nr:hypothetical protein C8R45DRAFT_1205860 [Mycena sanguinolenta]
MSLANSLFVNRLHTNYVSSDPESLEILFSLVQRMNLPASLDARIKELEIALAQLKEQRVSLEGPINAHKALMSPITRLPPDILLDIFFACLPSEYNAPNTEAPLVLGHICKLEEYFALDTHTLELTAYLENVEAWLERSGTCPLTVSITDYASQFRPNVFENHPLVLQLLPVSRRIRHLKMDGDIESLGPFLRLDTKGLSLRSIWIETGFNIAPNHVQNLANVLQLPTLEDVTVRLNVTQCGQTGLNVTQCGQSMLRKGVSTSAEHSMCSVTVRILYTAQSRVTRASEPPGSTLIDMPPIILLYMRTLVLSGWPAHLHKWIPHLVVPNLCLLRVGEVVVQDKAVNVTRDGQMCAEIDPHQFTSYGLHQLLQRFPTISHLRLTSRSSPQEPIALDDMFMALFCPPRGLCPMLTNLTIASCTRFSDTTALDFVKARIAMHILLQAFRFDCPMEVDVIPELHSFIPTGLAVTFKYYPRKFLTE